MNGLKMVLEHQGLPNFSNAGLQPALQLYAAAAAHLAPRNRVPPWAPFLQFGVPGVFGSPFLTRPRFGPTPGGGPPGLAGLNGLNGKGGPHQLPNNRTMPGPPSEDSNEDREHHVHFDTTTLKDEFESENGLTYQKSGDSIVVHLGFLQINHRYLIELKLPATLFKCNAEPITLVPENEAMPNIHCKLVEFSGKSAEQSDFIDVKVEYFAHKEKLLKEELKLINATNSEELLKLVITARVLGKGKGTPMLRNGIHCVGVQEDEESEASDFQGFGTN